MRVVFAGTPEFAAHALRRLHGAGHALPLVLTQPDRPAGRGMKLQPSAVKEVALALGAPVAQPRSLRLDGKFAEDAAAARTALQEAAADVMVVAAYGLILPQWVLDLMRAPRSDGSPGLGCLNIHASLLPRWRGAAPIHRAIEAGDTDSGVTIMQMDAGLDTGDMLLRRAVPIRQQPPQADTTGSLHDRLAALGADMIVQALALAGQGALQASPQPADGITYAHKIDKAEAAIDWSQEAAVLERRVRAFDPAPGAWTLLGADVLKIWQAEVLDERPPAELPPGAVWRVDPNGVDVACGVDSLRLRAVQRAGGKRMDAAAFARGAGLQPGTRLGPDRDAG